MKLFKTKTKEQFDNLMAMYMPLGRAFGDKNRIGSDFRLFLDGLAGEIKRAYDDMNNLSEDYDLLVTNELLGRWESSLGIPDGCFNGTGSKAERRLHVLIKFAKMNVQTSEQMRQLAVSLGFADAKVAPLNENVFPPYNVPFVPSSTPSSRYVIQITATGAVTNVPPYDVPFTPASENGSLLSCVFSIVKPANCRVVFSNVPTPPINPVFFNAVGWYDGADLISFVLSGSEISTWSNKGNGSQGNLAQSTSSLRPNYVATVQNGNSIVRFSGGQSLNAVLGNVLDAPLSDYTIMLVAKRDDTEDAGFVMNWTNGGELKAFINYQDGDIPDDAQEVIDPDTTKNQFEIITVVRQGTKQSIQVNNEAIITNEESTDISIIDKFQVGAFDTDFYLNGDIGEIAIFPSVLSGNDTLLMKNYLNLKWGL